MTKQVAYLEISSAIPIEQLFYVLLFNSESLDPKGPSSRAHHLSMLSARMWAKPETSEVHVKNIFLKVSTWFFLDLQVFLYFGSVGFDLVIWCYRKGTSVIWLLGKTLIINSTNLKWERNLKPDGHEPSETAVLRLPLLLFHPGKRTREWSNSIPKTIAAVCKKKIKSTVSEWLVVLWE